MLTGLFRARYETIQCGRYAARVTAASWPRRIGALFIDWFIALLSAAAVTGTSVADPEGAGPWWPLLMYVVEVGLLTGLLGYSIGKRCTGIKVINTGGGSIGLARALLRSFLVVLVIPPLVNTPDRRGLQDLAAGSMVVRAA